MRFLTDQDVYESTTKFLASLGHNVLRCREAGLAKSSDEELISYAFVNDYLLVTRDKGFGALVFAEKYQNPGVIFLRMEPQSVEFVHNQLNNLLRKFTAPEIKRFFVVIEETRFRIRKTG